MSDNAPPPYPGGEKGNPAYPPPGQGYPQQPGYQPGPGYPQQPPYGPAQYNAPGQTGTTVVVTQPSYAVIQHFRETPVRLKCQYCQADVVTATYYETGTLTWIACFVIAIVGCWLGCCLIPFCMDACKDVIHQCPNCHQQLGRYNRYGQPGYGQPADPSQVHIQEGRGAPPQGGYYPQQPGAPTTVVVTQPTVAVVQTFRESPVHTRCPHCQAEVVTGTSYETGTFAWIICVVLCVIGCDLGCCLIPFCVDGCKDVVHICPNCRQQIARWSRM